MSKAITLDNIPVIKELVQEEIEGNTPPSMVAVTYAELLAKVNAGELMPGQQYRITDYVTTTAQANTQSAGHAFDIIVTADSTDTLNENARAVLHEGDTYFASQNLAAWTLKYDINNDKAKYAWASSSGKGVIYEMTDEYGNTAPYDFKNIQFRRFKISSQSKGNDMAWLVNLYAGRYSITSTSSKLPSFAAFDTSDGIYMFTFGIRTTTGVISDASLNASGKYCYENVIEPYYYNNNKRYLNGITFHNTLATQNMYGNEFDANCRDMWFYSNCYANKFKDNCYSNTFGQGCNNNTFGQDCGSNTFADSSWGNKALSNAMFINEQHPTPEPFVCKEFGVIPPQEWEGVEIDDYLGYNGTFYNATAVSATLTIDYEIEILYTKASGRDVETVTGSTDITIQPYSFAIADCTVSTTDIPFYEDYDGIGLIIATASYSVGDAYVAIKNIGN